MPRDYTVQFEHVTVSAAQDFLELTPADDKPCYLMGMKITQDSEVGDAQEEFLRVSVVRGNTTSGSGGSAPTPAPMDSNDSASGFTAEVNNTTVASSGTAVTLHSESFNERGLCEQYWPDERTAPRVSQGNTLMCVRLNAAPADAVSMSGTFYVREM